MDDPSSESPEVAIETQRFYAIRKAAYSNHEEALRLIAADPTILEARNELGETALHWHVVENCLEAVLFLARQGADVNNTGSPAEAPIKDAAHAGNVDMVALLLQFGAKVDGRELLDMTPATSDKKAFAEVLQLHGIRIKPRKVNRHRRAK